MQFYANRGYAVQRCNFRGSGGYGRAFIFAAAGLNSHKMTTDILDAVDEAIKRKIADPNKVAIVGGSHGGGVVLQGLTLTPDKFACGVERFGPSNNTKSALETRARDLGPVGNAQYGRLELYPGSPEEIRALENSSPINFVQRVTKPLLIMHGGKDTAVPRSHSDEFVKVMKQLGKPVTYVLFPGEGHGFEWLPHVRISQAFSELFLKNQCLGGRAEPLGTNWGSVGLQVYEHGGLP